VELRDCCIGCRIEHAPWSTDETPLLGKAEVLAGNPVNNEIARTKNTAALVSFDCGDRTYIGNYRKPSDFT
jgi:hypothetical protein